MAFTPAKNIQEVIDRLDVIIDAAIQKNDPIGLFPALYVVVTEKVRDAIKAGNVFEDGPRMEKLDVIFANRYLEAFEQFSSSQEPTRSWEVAFEAAQNGKHQIILQYLLMGMNAHINLDLGIAAATTCPGALIQGLESDFMTINKILASLVDAVKGDLEKYSPRFKLILRHMTNEDAILQFSIEKARNAAWKFSQELAAKPQHEWEKAIEIRDFEVRVLASLIRNSGFIGAIIVWWVRQRESKDYATIIKDLRNNYHNRVPLARFAKQ